MYNRAFDNTSPSRCLQLQRVLQALCMTQLSANVIAERSDSRGAACAAQCSGHESDSHPERDKPGTNRIIYSQLYATLNA